MRCKFTILLFFFSVGAFAQQDPLYNQHHFNQLLTNPAYTGIHNLVSISAISRSQWSGIDGAPFTNAFIAHTSLLRNKIGLGLMAINDQIGINSNTEFHLTYSYKIIIGPSTLSFGLQTSVINYQYRYDKLNLEVVNDPNFLPTDENFTKPNFGAGIMLMNERYFVGFSVPRILNINLDDGIQESTRYHKHYYLAGGVLLPISNFIKFKPSTLIKMVEGASVSIDLNSTFIFGEFVSGGLILRNLNALGVIVQVELADKFRIGYSFELPTNSLIASNYGTHEFLLAMDFAPFKRQILKRRYF